jgi:hypothetical protein
MPITAILTCFLFTCSISRASTAFTAPACITSAFGTIDVIDKVTSGMNFGCL